jgi:methyl-accepting chemotaxis protein
MKKTLTIAQRVGLSAGFLCTVLAGIVIFGIASVVRINRISDSIVKDALPGLIDAQKVRALAAANQIAFYRLLRSSIPEERRALTAEMSANTAVIDEALADYEKTIYDPADRRNFDLLKTRRVESLKARADALASIDADAATLNAKLEAQFAAYTTYSKIIDVIADYNAHNGDVRGGVLSNQVSTDIRVFSTIGILSLIVGIGSATIAVLGIRRVLQEVASTLGAGAEQTAAAASQVSASSQSLASGATQQASSLEETSAALAEMASMTKKNSESAAQAKTLSNETRQAAESGAASMAEMKKAMDAIKESSASIGKIVKTIDEIAFQTNILALNAAVEAARAGEAGAGFAVVADEVRSLAQRSAESAKETAARIEDSVLRSEYGVKISTEVAANFERIVSKARNVDELVGEIAASSNEQSQGIGQVNSAVLQIDKVTQTNTAGAEEAASAAEELNAQSEMMRDSVRSLQQLVGDRTRVGAPSQTRARENGAPERKPAKRAASPHVRSTSIAEMPAALQSRISVGVPAMVLNGNGHADVDEYFK